MHAWQHVDITFDVSQFIMLSTVRASTFNDQPSNDVRFQLIHRGSQCFGANGIFRIRVRNHFFFNRRLHRVDGFCAILLTFGQLSRSELLRILFNQLIGNSIVFRFNEFLLLNITFFIELVLQFTYLLNALVSIENGFHHLVFRHFTSKAFDHQDFFQTS